jgi:signal transduction histidine kinase
MTWWIVFQIDNSGQTANFLIQKVETERRWAISLLNGHYARLAQSARNALSTSQPIDILLADPAVSGVVHAGSIVGGMNDSLWLRVDDGRKELILFLNRSFPEQLLGAGGNLRFTPPHSGQMPRPEWVIDQYLITDPLALSGIYRAHDKHLRMFIMEGSFFFLLIIIGGYIVFLALKRSRQMREEQLLFVHSITHELKIPITAINLFVDTLKRRGYDPALAADVVPKIKEDAARLNRMIDNILQVRQLSDRQMEFKSEIIDLSSDLTRFTEQIKDKVASAGATVRLNAAPGLRIAGDGIILTRIWETLIDNSLKYGRSGGLSLSITARQIRDAAEIEFLDNGPGIPDGMEEKLFEPFFRGHIEESRSIAGSGLGLYIAREFVHRLGGTITIGNAPKGGCLVTMKFKAVS